MGFYQLVEKWRQFHSISFHSIEDWSYWYDAQRIDFDELWFSSLIYCNWYLMKNCWTRIIWQKEEEKNKKKIVPFGCGSINLHGIRLSMKLVFLMNEFIVFKWHALYTRNTHQFKFVCVVFHEFFYLRNLSSAKT